jgi:hypothetical protein
VSIFLDIVGTKVNEYAASERRVILSARLSKELAEK